MPPPENTDAKNLFDFRNFEKVYNKVEDEKLKSPAVLPLPSPIFTTDKHINHVGKNQEVFEAIKKRLMNFTPPISVDDHIVHNWERIKELTEHRYLPVVAQRDLLSGIDFIVEDRNKLLCAVRNARADINKPAFVEGTKNDWSKHWALALSFAATEGVGFREIFRPTIAERPLQELNKMPFDSRLGRDVRVDVSSLHIAVADFKFPQRTRCNIHVDQMTVTLGGITDEVGISPTAIGHIVNELLFKTKLRGKLPDWILDAFDISLLDPHTGFLNAGVGATIVNKPHFKWTINYSVGLNNNTNLEWSGSFKFEKSVGTGISITF